MPYEHRTNAAAIPGRCRSKRWPQLLSNFERLRFNKSISKIEVVGHKTDGYQTYSRTSQGSNLTTTILE
jgi:hypothetical protein